MKDYSCFLESIYYFLLNCSEFVIKTFEITSIEIKLQNLTANCFQTSVKRFLASVEHDVSDIQAIILFKNTLKSYCDKMKIDEDAFNSIINLYLRLSVGAKTHFLKQKLSNEFRDETWSASLKCESEKVNLFNCTIETRECVINLLHFCSQLNVDKNLIASKVSVIIEFFIRNVEKGLIEGEAVRVKQIVKINSKILCLIISACCYSI